MLKVVLDAMDGGQFRESVRRDVTARVEQAAQQYARRLKSLDGIARNSNGPLKAGALLALAYPERIGGGSRGKGRYTFSGGGAAQLQRVMRLRNRNTSLPPTLMSLDSRLKFGWRAALLAKMWNRCSMNKSSDAKLSNGPRRPTRRCAIERALGSVVLDTHPLANPSTEALKRRYLKVSERENFQASLDREFEAVASTRSTDARV